MTALWLSLVGVAGVLMGSALTAALTSRRDYRTWMRQEKLSVCTDVLELADLRDHEIAKGWEQGRELKLAARVLLVAPELAESMLRLIDASREPTTSAQHRDYGPRYKSARNDFLAAALADLHGRRRGAELVRTLRDAAP